MTVADAVRLAHGERRTYRAGCRCVVCRRANSQYWKNWWTAKKTGRLPLGARISAAEAHRIIKLLKLEWRSRMALARDLGLHHGLARLTRQQRITLRTELRVRHLYRTRMLEHPDRRRHGTAHVAVTERDGMTPEAFIAFVTQHETQCPNSRAQVAMIGNVVRLQCSACLAKLEVTFEHATEPELDGIAEWLHGSRGEDTRTIPRDQ